MARVSTVSLLKRGFTLIEILVVLAVIGVLIALLFPATRSARPAAKRSQCRNNLKHIGLAMHNYHDAHGAFPPAYTVDVNGKPLHSWRTLLLPYLDQQALYNRIDLTKPWDDPVNAEAFNTTLVALNCPSAKYGTNQTNYMAVVTSSSILRPRSSCAIRDVTDGTSNTLLVVEVDVDQAVPWMVPRDVDEAYFLHFGGKTTKTSHVGGIHILLADGTVRFLSENSPTDIRRAIMTIDGKETVGEY